MSLISISNNRSKTIWNLVNHERPRRNLKGVHISSDEFNLFFSSISEKIAQSIDNNISIDPLIYLNKLPKPVSTFFISPILETDVQQAILRLKNSTHPDYYGLNSSCIKLANIYIFYL